MHGSGGTKDQPHIRAMVEAFLEAGYGVVSFDTTHTIGESEGEYEDATLTNYYADLVDVIEWSAGQSYYTEPFVLCGHSLGGIAVALFAEKHSKKVRALAPIFTVISGALSLAAVTLFPDTHINLTKWQRDGVRVSLSHDGKVEKRLKWAYVEDRSKYDLLPEVNALTMPVLMIVGERDHITPPVHQQILFDKLAGKKELHIIPGALHGFHEAHEQRQLKALFRSWITKI